MLSMYERDLYKSKKIIIATFEILIILNKQMNCTWCLYHFIAIFFYIYIKNTVYCLFTIHHLFILNNIHHKITPQFLTLQMELICNSSINISHSSKKQSMAYEEWHCSVSESEDAQLYRWFLDGLSSECH